MCIWDFFHWNIVMTEDVDNLLIFLKLGMTLLCILTEWKLNGLFEITSSQFI